MQRRRKRPREEAEGGAAATPNPYAEGGAILRGHSRPVYGLDFSADERLLLSASGDGTVRLWSTDIGANLVAYRCSPRMSSPRAQGLCRERPPVTRRGSEAAGSDCMTMMQCSHEDQKQAAWQELSCGDAVLCGLSDGDAQGACVPRVGRGGCAAGAVLCERLGGPHGARVGHGARPGAAPAGGAPLRCQRCAVAPQRRPAGLRLRRPDHPPLGRPRRPAAQDPCWPWLRGERAPGRGPAEASCMPCLEGCAEQGWREISAAGNRLSYSW